MYGWSNGLKISDNGEIVPIERHEWHRVPIEESPWRKEEENDETSTQEGETDEIPEESEE